MKTPQDQKVIIVTHEFFKGSGQELKEYLVAKKSKKVLYIAHKFFYSGSTFSYFELYENGKLVNRGRSRDFPKKEYFLYVKDFLITLKYIFTLSGSFDMYVGSGAFNVLPGIVAKLFGKVKHLNFFTIDYVMKGRFGNALLDKLYVFLDRLAFFASDSTWNVSDRMSRQRILEIGELSKRKLQIEVPVGAPIDEANAITVDRKDNLLVYSGSLLPEFGLEIIIDSLPKLAKKIPGIKVRIMGKGPLEEKLKARIRELGVEGNVDFIGYIDTTKERTRWLTLLKESTIGLATYEDNKTTYKRFSDVTKPKDYIACGLVIFTTSVIPFSEIVIKENLGRVVDYNEESFVSGIVELLADKEELRKIQENVKRFAPALKWENIFDNTFNKLL